MSGSVAERPVAELLADLSSRGIHLWLDGDALRYRAPRTGLTPDVRDQLKTRKEAILDLLRKRSLVVPMSARLELEHDSEGRFEPFALSDIQQAYWLGSTSAFELGNISAHLYLEREVDELDLGRLEAAWNQLIARHDMLRSRVVGQGEQQVMAEAPHYAVEQEDLRSLDPETAWERVRATRERMAENGPPLDRWPLFELRASRLDERATVIHLSLSLLIGDALSSQVLYNELLQLYQQPDGPLPSLDITFRDVITGLAEVRRSEGYQRSLEYWRGRLDSLPPAPELPLAKSPGSVGASRFSRRSGRLTGRAWERLRERASAAGLTPTAVMATVYGEVMARWSKHQHFLLNVLFFNRLAIHPQIHRIVGNFSSTILLEYDGRDRTAGFADRVRKLQDQLWRDIEHAQVSGVQVLRELNQRQGGGARPAVPVVFASTLNLSGGTGGAAATTVQEGRERENPDRLQTPQVWIDHQVSERGGVLEYNWDAVEELFAPGFLDTMFAAYEGLLHELSAEEADWQNAPTDLVMAEQLVPRQQRNQTDAPISEATLHGLFCRRAAEAPERPAVIADGRTLTYAELFLRAEHWGERLRQLGARPGELVAMVMDKDWEQVVAAMGVLFSGASYLPIQADLPSERIHYILDHGQVRFVLTQGHLVDTLDWPAGVEVMAVGMENGDDAVDPATFDISRAAGFEPVQKHDDLAYVIYTSGSTGLPKGVMIDHRGAVNTLLDINRRFGVGPDDRVLALSSMSFDLSVYDVFGLLAAGGALVIPSSDAMREPSRWVELVERHRVSLWDTVPALMVMQVDYLEGHGAQLASSLRLVMMSGDWIPVGLPDRIRALASRAEGIDVMSLGGATEASIWSITYPIEKVDPEWVSIPYGAPMVNQRFHVLNDRLEPAPVWVPGQLYIAGIGVALGYWRDAERTGASFITHPVTGERLYRTGDLGRYLPDGHIEFLGREDFQVKIQGYRIELGEIETVLAQHEAVRDAVVVAVGQARGVKRLVGYYTREEGVDTATGDDELAERLREFLGAKLPEYMVPATLGRLDEVPLTANGKVDRSVLAQPTGGAEVEHVPPRDDVELRLSEIWQELLERSPIGVREGFFDLGGHSLMAVRLMNRIEQELGRELPLSVLFEAPTIEQLAELLRREGTSGHRPALVRIQPLGEAPPFFCVHPVGGNVLCYLDLAREIGQHQPFFGLQVPDLEHSMEDDTTVEALAADYLDALRAEQPTGPYFLGGWSMGGVVAYEMARQLRRQGETVARVLMIDAIDPQIEKQHADGGVVDDAMLLSWFARDLGGLNGEDLVLDPETLRPLSIAEGLARLVDAAHAAGVLPEELGVEAMGQPWAIFRRNFRALLHYHPSDYDGDLDLYIAEDTAAQETDPSLGWSQATTGELRTRQLPGNHFTIVQPPIVEELAQLFRDALAQPSA